MEGSIAIFNQRFAEHGIPQDEATRLADNFCIYNNLNLGYLNNIKIASAGLKWNYCKVRPHQSMNINHILVPVDFSEGTSHAIDYAIGIGKSFSSRITLFHVMQPLPPPPDQFTPPFDAWEQALLEVAKKKLWELSTSLTLDIEVETDITYGIPWASIVERAQQDGIDLIVMPTHGRTALKHLLMGSVAERVVRYAPCAVLIVRQNQPSDAE
ncbi:MAG: universal stress protein [Verrucomicrobiales bacterium]|nr:universal stress protein [Verrucomicrobiales bacterium]